MSTDHNAGSRVDSKGWAQPDLLDDFDRSDFSADGVTHPVFRQGSGPCVLVIHEVPGLTPAVADFARDLVRQGFSVACPLLVGEAGRPMTNGYVAKSFLSVCISREFTVMAAGKSSPITVWLRSLARHEHERCGGPGVGVVGMCFSGGFALAMATDPSVIAPVLSQPSFPFAAPWKKSNAAAIDASAAELATVKERMRADEDLCFLGYRFSNDPLVPKDRFAYLKEQLGERFVGVTFDSSVGNIEGRGAKAHSVLTTDRVPQAVDEVVAFMKKRLLTSR